MTPATSIVDGYPASLNFALIRGCRSYHENAAGFSALLAS